MADKHIRLDSQFNVVGAFWAPDELDFVQTGILTADTDGITFTTAPQYSRGHSIKSLISLMRLSESGAAPRMPVLHGFTEDGLCTLCQLVEAAKPGLIDRSLGQSIEANSYRVSVCVTGIHIGALEDKCLTSAQYTFTGLSEWVPEAASEFWEHDQIVLRIPHNAKDIFSLCVRESRIHVSLKVFSELKTNEADGGRLSRPIAYIKIESPTPESLSWYRNVGNRLENLFSLLLGTSLALETVFVYRDTESGHVIAKGNPHIEKFGLLDCVRCTPSQLATCVAIWLCEPEEFRSVENLALGVLRKGKLFWETEFLSLAQALEGLHRATTPARIIDKATLKKIRRAYTTLLKQESVETALAQQLCAAMSHANDPPFALRLRELCSRVSEFLLLQMGIEREKFVADVVATRNFYTHAGSKANSRRNRNPVSGPALFFLNQKLRALLRGALLLHLALPEEQISSLLEREATRWH